MKELWEEMSLFEISRLYTTDTKVLNHILINSYDHEKLPETRVAPTNVLSAANLRELRIMLTSFSGLLVVEGNKHKQQLRDFWAEECTKQEAQGRIEILSWLTWTTLDVVGLPGFNIIFQAGTSVNVMSTQSEPGDAEAKKASSTMSHIGNELLSNSMAAVSQNESLEKDTWNTRALLSLLVTANVATDLTQMDPQKLATLVKQPRNHHRTTAENAILKYTFLLRMFTDIQNGLPVFDIWSDPQWRKV
ncbi:hypothetical protein K443DRAFT_121232 [Laccaria amethystina LaAM-08-1]|uniref:Uncharacterized protein n=1 Tax=Laccaria amethystina LaAM-08-1 TaxID=1095629 RepID=A0A0C9XG04_9AGAR|nr:hypothetical protein K443DRAFT_121232 [Laccaria amethystina LaAM-08-1]